MNMPENKIKFFKTKKNFEKYLGNGEREFDHVKRNWLGKVNKDMGFRL